MGLFGRHDYGRDYRGGGRGLGDRIRGAWERFEGRMGGYDRDMRGGGGGGGYDASDFAYRGLDGAYGTARNRGAHDVQWDWRRAGGSPYDQDTPHAQGGYGRDYAARGYDRGMRGGPAMGRPSFGGARRQLQAGPDRYDVGYRGWNGGIGDEPGYQGRGFRGWDRGRR